MPAKIFADIVTNRNGMAILTIYPASNVVSISKTIRNNFIIEPPLIIIMPHSIALFIFIVKKKKDIFSKKVKGNFFVYKHKKINNFIYCGIKIE